MLICLFETTGWHCYRTSCVLVGKEETGQREGTVRVEPMSGEPSVQDGEPVHPPTSPPGSLYLVPTNTHLSGEVLQTLSRSQVPNSRVYWLLMKSVE